MIKKISKDYTKKFCNGIGFGLSKESAMNFANKENNLIFENKKGVQGLDKQLKTKLENLVSTIADGAVLLDNNLNIILINEAALNLLGLRKTIPLIRTPLWKHLPVDIQK